MLAPLNVSPHCCKTHKLSTVTNGAQSSSSNATAAIGALHSAWLDAAAAGQEAAPLAAAEATLPEFNASAAGNVTAAVSYTLSNAYHHRCCCCCSFLLSEDEDEDEEVAPAKAEDDDDDDLVLREWLADGLRESSAAWYSSREAKLGVNKIFDPGRSGNKERTSSSSSIDLVPGPNPERTTHTDDTKLQSIDKNKLVRRTFHAENKRLRQILQRYERDPPRVRLRTYTHSNEKPAS